MILHVNMWLFGCSGWLLCGFLIVSVIWYYSLRYTIKCHQIGQKCLCTVKLNLLHRSRIKWKSKWMKRADCGIKFRSAYVAPYSFLRIFAALRIITNHTRFRWAYECIGQSEAFRWVIAETLEFCWVYALADWIHKFSHHKQQNADVWMI